MALARGGHFPAPTRIYMPGGGGAIMQMQIYPKRSLQMSGASLGSVCRVRIMRFVHSAPVPINLSAHGLSATWALSYPVGDLFIELSWGPADRRTSRRTSRYGLSNKNKPCACVTGGKGEPALLLMCTRPGWHRRSVSWVCVWRGDESIFLNAMLASPAPSAKGLQTSIR